ncbi:16S rRNA (guanine(527)-N(7))-methyltransferase RsmG [Mycoplasmopsis gallopavonis]|uniref:Ribosomal RNA small subunit methyltransferase G n=1 Tax=Mycoplasmopsis gallopavonis TaxID=76629 RepID=A0A449AYR3_9BACT|nr:16S rRNA (guanine(527)-N(7))-methyltransferase RsmG [Mycoplasmopsis gallopavonis]RIV16519.1 16S rRNA (guanine(527)-N(7))-methyltransferase RsmG [Mycoplasmopsis gallopavonis]VEU72586.1 glucose-inhibited division protein B [Mycoplasmopsis gallopavonis]
METWKYKQIVQKMCIENNWDFTLFEKYVNLIEEKNKVMNLTGFSGDTLWHEGILESLLTMQEITKGLENGEILDIGAGVGFPSLPYALTTNSNHITIYEPLQKRVNFLNLVINELGLQNKVKVEKKRVEEETNKNLYDLVTARAVSSVRNLLMAGFHTVKLHGNMSLLKSKNSKQEIEEAQEILKLLNVKLDDYLLENPLLPRTTEIVKITKLRSTPKQFPFSWKEIVKKNN